MNSPSNENPSSESEPKLSRDRSSAGSTSSSDLQENKRSTNKSERQDKDTAKRIEKREPAVEANGEERSATAAKVPCHATVESLVQQHQDGLWRYLRAMGCDSAAAEDIVQDTFVTLLRTPYEDQGEAALAGFLRTIARNFFISRQRRERRVRSVAEVEEIDHRWTEWVGDGSGDELVDALKSCLKELTPRAQQALQLRFRELASRTDIADALEMSEHGAKNLMQRAKHQLRRCIELRIK